MPAASRGVLGLKQTGLISGHVARRTLPLILLVPLIYLAAQGHFSFEYGEATSGGFAPGAVVNRSTSVLGDVVLPGLVYAIIVYFLLKDRHRVFQAAQHFKMLTLLGVVAICSTLWSQNPLHSLELGIFYLIGTFFAYWLVMRFEPTEIMSLVQRTGLIASIVGLLLVIFLPKYGTSISPREGLVWIGIFVNRTGAAKVSVFFMTPALIGLVRRVSATQVLYVLLLSLMIIKAHAVSSVFVLFVYFATLIFLRFSRKIGTKISVALAVYGVILVSIIAILGYNYLPDILRAFGRDPTLTGRTTVWALLRESILKRPLLGYGFSAFWQGLEGESGRVINSLGWTLGYAHNGMIEILLQVGVVGGFVFLCTFVKAMKDAWFCFRHDRLGKYDWYIGLIVLTIVYNLDEETFFFGNDLLSIIYIVMCCGLALAVKQLKEDRRRQALIADGNRMSFA